MIKVQNLVYLLLSLALASCAGGGDSGSSDPSGSTRTVRGVATIVDANTANIGRTTLDLSSASVTMDGAEGSSADISDGQVITCSAEMSDDTHGTATECEFDDDLQGLVLAQIDDTTYNVMGQTVLTDDATIIDGTIVADAADPLDNSVVEISGYPDADGNIVASRIEVKDDREVEVTGHISDLNIDDATGDGSFMIGSLTVNFTADALGDLVLADGDYVEVESTVDDITDTSPDAPAMNAGSIELEDELHGMGGEENEDTSFTGVITAVADDGSSFVMDGITVIVTDTTEIYEGVVIAVDSTVEVHGTFDAEGNVVASEIEPVDIPGDGVTMDPAPAAPADGTTTGGNGPMMP